MSEHFEQRPIILASGSPRRFELMTRVGLDPVVRVADIPETPNAGESPREYTRRLATEKAATVAAELETPSWTIAADTVVVRESEILEKPQNDEHAFEMLESLSGRSHEVMTSFAIRGPDGQTRVETVETEVWFRTLDEVTIRHYVATGEPSDKAGAYGIQGIGALLIDRIEGCYFNVVGLPISRLAAALQELGAIEYYPRADASHE